MGLGHEKEEATGYDGNPIDPDPDSESDLDETKPQQRGGGEDL